MMAARSRLALQPCERASGGQCDHRGVRGASVRCMLPGRRLWPSGGWAQDEASERSTKTKRRASKSPRNRILRFDGQSQQIVPDSTSTRLYAVQRILRALPGTGGFEANVRKCSQTNENRGSKVRSTARRGKALYMQRKSDTTRLTPPWATRAPAPSRPQTRKSCGPVPPCRRSRSGRPARGCHRRWRNSGRTRTLARWRCVWG